jgi:peptidylprolyl isomerase
LLRLRPVAESKRERQRQSRQAKQAALEAARRRAAMRRRAVFTAAAVLVALLVVVLLTRGGDDKKKAVTTSSSTSAPTTAATPTTALPSAAGKPCVPVADPLPAGAPAVPVKEGPPPAALVTEDLKQGTGDTVNPGDTLSVNYIGVACSTGKIFDSSWAAGQPASFALSQVIKGWQDGIPGMKVGGQRLLGIPPAQGYGDKGFGGKIGPGETLWFVVEVLRTQPA